MLYLQVHIIHISNYRAIEGQRHIWGGGTCSVFLLYQSCKMMHSMSYSGYYSLSMPRAINMLSFFLNVLSRSGIRIETLPDESDPDRSIYGLFPAVKAIG